MKKTCLTVILSVLVFVAFLASNAFAGEPAKRQVRQQQRIYQGIASGSLTKGETFSLQKQQNHIQKMKRQSWQDGRLTVGERIKIDNAQDRASNRIYRLKHNDKDR